MGRRFRWFQNLSLLMTPFMSENRVSFSAALLGLEITIVGVLLAFSNHEIEGTSFENSSIVINEINYNSADVFNPEDWVEFHNSRAETLDLSGWLFTDVDEEVHSFVFPDGTLLDSDGFVIICRDISLFSNAFPQAKPILGEFGFGLSGGDEAILLYDNLGVLIDSLFYDDNSPWPSSADGMGATLTLIDPSFDNTNPESWKASDDIGGSPGSPNNPRRGKLVINEFMAQNSSSVPGPLGEFSDWIELHNQDGNSLALKGIYLTDNLEQPTQWEFPDTTIGPFGYLLIWAESNSQNTIDLQTNFRLSRDGEQIGLFDRDSWRNMPLDTLSFGTQEPDISVGRSPNGTGAFLSLTNVTPNAHNQALASDFDSNGVVDFTDFLLFVSHYGFEQNQPQYAIQYDLDRNAVIDFSDFLIFVQSFGN